MMKAAPYHVQDNQVHINEISIPKPQPFELSVKTLDSSLCHSDLMNFEPNELSLRPINPDTLPITLGHEASGVAVQARPDCKGSTVRDEIG
jgi:D-arabinose 1-dehydrogenase-like Zn-dependent alcohol dehydrogenase